MAGGTRGEVGGGGGGGVKRGEGGSKGWVGVSGECSSNLEVGRWVNRGLSDWFQTSKRVFG